MSSGLSIPHIMPILCVIMWILAVNVYNGFIQSLQQTVLKQLGLELKSSSYSDAFCLHPGVDACVGLNLSCVWPPDPSALG